MSEENNPIKIAYATAKLLVNKGYKAGVLVGADEVSVGFYIGDRLMEIKVHQGLADKGSNWLADNIEESIKKIN